MIGRERAVPLNRAVRSGTIANPRPEIGRACQHLISNRLMRQNVPSGCRVTGRRVRDIEGSGPSWRVTRRRAQSPTVTPPVRVISDCASAPGDEASGDIDLAP
jgi:hypothetical protein